MNAAASDTALMADIADCICKQLHALASDPSPGRAAEVAINLDGARRTVLALRKAMMSEVSDDHL